PEENWGPQDYADHIADWLRTLPKNKGKRIWVGHSFGCRIGIRLAAKHPELIDGLFLISAAGLKRQRTLLEKLTLKAKIYTYKAGKKLAPLLGISQDALRKHFGSADYQNAGELRDILVKTVSEDLTEIAKKVPCPVHLAFGEKDDQTPPEMGKRYQNLIRNATLFILPGLNHYSILGPGHHQVVALIKNFIEKISNHD
ncbi:uncharacterized protein LOC111320385, partial [Stylophora pistillata]|uniref:uncharacterized protein LOC111320385 n=1 Tax=Stylophora pistillata TaxID=50429 RepID=UPI000C04FEE4